MMTWANLPDGAEFHFASSLLPSQDSLAAADPTKSTDPLTFNSIHIDINVLRQSIAESKVNG